MTAGGRTITLLGRVAIATDGPASATAGPRGRRGELVFAYLAAEHHRLVSNDELADCLWPDGPPETWEAALRGVLTDVRRFLTDHGLEPSTVLTTVRRGHQMVLPADVVVDLDEARGSLAAARASLADGDAAGAATRAARAAGLGRLPFLPAHDGEWVDGIRRELETLTARALEVEARAHAQAGDPAAAASAAARLVEAEPFNEGAHQLRIRILGEAGDRAGALKAYEHCVAVLAAELGVEPSDATSAALRAATDRVAGPAAANGMAGLSVLVVEDHAFQRRTAVMLLRNLGVGEVSEAGDGAEALARLKEIGAPDVILCDIDMPGMDGVEFVRHVAETEGAGAVIIASALDAKVVQAVGSVSEGYGLQVLGAIEKPLTARRLGELLAAYRPRARPSVPAAGGWSISGDDARAAIDDGRISFLLQPIVDVATGQVTAVEASPGWDEPGRGSVPADAFVPVLERDGLLGSLFELALSQVCERLGATARDVDVPVAVALAPEALQDADLPDRVAGVARAASVDPGLIVFELEEEQFRHAPSAALDVLTRLRVKGFGVSLVGFGASRSRAGALTGLPLTEVQLAPALVSGAAADPARAQELEEAIEVARALDVVIVGDGCDGEEDLRLLLGLGCDRVQGSLIAGPMPVDHLAGWIAAWDPTRLVVGEPG